MDTGSFGPLQTRSEFEDEMEHRASGGIDRANMSFILARLLNDVCGRLGARSLATNEIRVRLALENAPEHSVLLRLPVPMLDPEGVPENAAARIERKSADCAGPESAHLKAEPVKPRRTQHGLFLPSSPEPEKLELTVARLRHLLGEGQVGTPEPADTNRPDTFSMRAFAPRSAAVQGCVIAESPRLCLRRFRPPRYAQVIVVNRQPVRVASPSVNGRVVDGEASMAYCRGEWWRADAWNRNEWDIALESGALYRLFQEVEGGRWFVEGSYD